MASPKAPSVCVLRATTLAKAAMSTMPSSALQHPRCSVKARPAGRLRGETVWPDGLGVGLERRMEQCQALLKAGYRGRAFFCCGGGGGTSRHDRKVRASRAGLRRTLCTTLSVRKYTQVVAQSDLIKDRKYGARSQSEAPGRSSASFACTVRECNGQNSPVRQVRL